jgi:hypothetical protein
VVDDSTYVLDERETTECFRYELDGRETTELTKSLNCESFRYWAVHPPSSSLGFDVSTRTQFETVRRVMFIGQFRPLVFFLDIIVHHHHHHHHHRHPSYGCFQVQSIYSRCLTLEVSSRNGRDFFTLLVKVFFLTVTHLQRRYPLS